MANVLKVDVPDTTGDAYAEKALTFPTAFFVEYQWAITQATMAALDLAGGDENTAVGLNFSGNSGDGVIAADFGSVGIWRALGDFDPAFGAGVGLVIAGDTWHHIKGAYDGTTVTWTVNGSIVGSYALASVNMGSPIRFGATFEATVAGAERYYLKNLKIGTTLGGTDIFAPSLAVDLSAFDSTTNPSALSLVADPAFPDAIQQTQGVNVAFGSDALAASPVYTRIDDPSGINVVQGWQIRRGRTYMTDRTEAGTASVNFIDTAGVVDPTNSTGPFYPMNPNCPFTIAIQHPVTHDWHTVYTGLVQNMPTRLDVSAKFATGTINAADLFSLLAIDEIPPGLDYDSSSAGTNTANTIGDTTYAAQPVQDRMKAILADAGIPAARTDIFTGNVLVQFTTYPPGTQTLAALQDAADAEFPGVANLYCDKNNNVVFHGRKSRSDPTGTETGTDWVFTNWHVGDEPAVLANPTWALITGLEFDRDVAKIINASKMTPDGIDNPSTVPGTSDIPGQLSTDSGSITQYGNRVYSADNLLTLGGETDGKNALEETKLFSDYFTGNFHDAQNQISQLTFQGVPADAPYASATWDIICKVDIGDQVNVTTTHPGGGGFSAAPYFVDGISYTATNTGGSNFLNVTMTLDLSPAAYFTTAPFS